MRIGRAAVIVGLAGAGLASLLVFGPFAGAEPAGWRWEWQQTDFSKSSVSFDEIRSGGPPKDGIPPIDNPKFVAVAEIVGLSDTEPVIGLIIDGEARAYPLSVMIWHEIANDTVGGVPVTVTFCPLCNAAVVFDRRAGGRVLDFGTTGKLRNSDLVMYDRQTESWWQQFIGEAIVGEMTGTKLKMLPSRVESLARFRARAPAGKVLVPNNPAMRRYGGNPYVGYDSMATPFLYNGAMPETVAPLSRVVSLGRRGAWSFALVQRLGEIKLDDGIVIRWEPGQNSALDRRIIAESIDVGNITVQRVTTDGAEDVVHGVDFAFAYHAFFPESKIHTE